jgi:hypothetical protein
MATIDDDAVAAADKEMEERANRAKELLAQRYKGLKTQQVCTTTGTGYRQFLLPDIFD